MNFFHKKIYPILPGLLISFLIALVSQGLAKFIPQLGAATIAILLGILLGNTFLKMPILQKGTKFSESKLLEYSVVLLGATITFQTMMQIGWQGICFVLMQMTSTICFAILIGRKLQFSESTYLLMAGGNAVCGSSAIASIAPVIEADDEDRGLVITIVNLMGTVMMLLLPLISLGLFNQAPLRTGALIGGTLQSVGQVVGSASMVSVAATQMATLFKIMRIMMLVVVVFVFGRLHQHQTDEETPVDVTPKKIKILPWYVVGFFILCIFSSLHLIPHSLENLSHLVSSWFEVIALAAIGLRLDFKVLMRQGKRFAIYGAGLGLIEIATALLLIYLWHI